MKHQAILLAEKHEKDAELKIQQWNEVVKEWNAERMYKHLYEESLKKALSSLTENVKIRKPLQHFVSFWQMIRDLKHIVDFHLKKVSC